MNSKVGFDCVCLLMTSLYFREKASPIVDITLLASPKQLKTWQAEVIIISLSKHKRNEKIASLWVRREENERELHLFHEPDLWRHIPQMILTAEML